VYGPSREIFVANEKKAAELKQGISSDRRTTEQEDRMIVTTTPTVEGRPVKEYLGIVTGEAIVRATMSDLSTALEGMGNNRSPLYERFLVEGKDVAMKKLTDRARELGATAVVGLHLDYEEFAQMVMVSAVGTAVVIPDGK
jgi:uncharacterized protein YbjQ (UPF0145 family)